MMLWTAIAISVFGLVYCQGESSGLNVGEIEWECTQDHGLHPTDGRKFLQFAGGIREGEAVFEATCPTRLQVFSFNNGTCQCLYTPELRALLEQPCQVRLVGDSAPEEYDILIPNLDRETIEELYVRRSCYAVLPSNIVDFFLAQNVRPMFFNMTGCRCDWTPEALAIRSRPVGVGQQCERLVDQNFTNSAVSSDEVGNWIAVFPSSRQNNVTLSEDGSLFDGELAMVSYKLMGTDFTDMILVARFKASQTSSDQLVFTNICRDNLGGSGFVELMYNPNARRYSLQFFGSNVAQCTPQNAPGGNVDQVAQIIYRNGVVRLEVNGFDCDVSSLNPVSDTVDVDRLKFSSECPFQIGGAVFTDISQADFGREDNRVPRFDGIFKRFMAARDCSNPPQMVQDRILGNA
ncbi:uncharacterized protein LOC135471852 [Liolophura sinensis]|uniref:uncharacterized protein LOC135471852 n=1 Tax=Liolophura sinensis TaxID=3198878 RepID=UPI0031591060